MLSILRNKKYEMSRFNHLMSNLVKDSAFTLLAAGTPYYMYIKDLSPILTFGTAFLGFLAMSFKIIHDYNKYIHKPFIEKRAKKKEKKDE